MSDFCRVLWADRIVYNNQLRVVNKNLLEKFLVSNDDHTQTSQFKRINKIKKMHSEEWNKSLKGANKLCENP